MPKFTLTKAYGFSALHFLENPQLSEKENENIFGHCYRLHGHDYKIYVTVAGPISPTSGLLCSRDELNEVVEKIIIQPFHKKNLNDLLKETSGEALTTHFFLLLKDRLPGELKLLKLAVQETPKNRFEVRAEDLNGYPL